MLDPLKDNMHIGKLIGIRCEDIFADYQSTDNYRIDKNLKVHFPHNGAGKYLESSSHDLAHMLDHWMQGKIDRIYQDQFGWGPIGAPKKFNPEKALQAEGRTISIQLNLLKWAGYDKELIDVDSTLVEILYFGVYDLVLDGKDQSFSEMRKTLDAMLGMFTLEQVKIAFMDMLTYLRDNKKYVDDLIDNHLVIVI